MQDPYVQELTALLTLARDIKARLRDLEHTALEQSRSEDGAALGVTEQERSAVNRARNHLELAIEALGPTSPGFNPDSIEDLGITGFHPAAIREALEGMQGKKGDQFATDAELDAALGCEPEQPVAPESGKPSRWVKNRVDEIQRALTNALGDDDLFGGGDDEPPAMVEEPPEPEAQPEFIGNTDTLSVPELVGFFQLQEKTGILTIEAHEEEFKLEYLKGELIHAGSSSSPPGERLGEILIQLGYLTEDELEELLSVKSGAERLGDLLRRGGLIPEEALVQALQVQVQRIFHRLFDVGGCRFVFREGLDGEPSERVRYNITRLLLETARHRDEQRLAG